MDLGGVGVLGCEEFDELGLTCDLAGVLVAEGLGLGQHASLHLFEEIGDTCDEGVAWDALLVLGRTVAATDEDAATLHIARTDFNAERDTLFNPAPGFFPTT